MKIFHHFLTAPIFFVCVCVILFILCLQLSLAQAVEFTADLGKMDCLTYSLYGFAIVLLFIYKPDFQHRSKMWWAFLFLLVAAVFREMGMQHWLTSTDTTAFKIGFFKNPNNPLFEKIRATLILLLIVYFALYALLKNIRFLITGFFSKKNVPWTIATLGMVLVFSKIADRIPSLLKKQFQYIISPETKKFCTLYEEGLEALLPLLVCIALIQSHYNKRKLFSKN